VFLHCLALKRAFGGVDRVVWVPRCPNSLNYVNQALADGFCFVGGNGREEVQGLVGRSLLS
jgi:hypothetical protein